MKILILAVLLAGCAAQPERFLTKEQDDEMRKVCEEGCVTLPVSVWIQIQQIFQSFKGAI